MKFLILILSFFTFNNLFGQSDTLIVADSLILLSNGTVVKPGTLPESNISYDFNYYKIISDDNLILVKGWNKKTNKYFFKFYRKTVQNNGAENYYSWEEDILGFNLDNLEQVSYFDNGRELKSLKEIIVIFSR